MERRVLLAIFLSFLVLYAYQAFIVKPVPKVAARATAVPQSAGQTDSTISSSNDQAAPSGASTPPPAAPVAAALVGEPTERDVRVETRDVIAVFTNRGARLKSWRLKHYFDQDRQAQELVERSLANQPLPFTLRTPSETINATINSALFTVHGAPSGDGVTRVAVDLRFEYRDTAGVQAVKEFHLDPSSYIFTFRATVSEGERALVPAILWGPALGDVAAASRYVQAAEGLLYQNDKVQRLAPKDIAKQSTYEGDFRYAGVDDSYFLSAALFPSSVKVAYQPVSIPGPDPKGPARDLVAYSIEPRQAGAPIKFFAGPKDFDVLAAIGPDMTRAINFGMFSVIVVPLLRSLKWVNGYVGNYGWSIVILTIIINAIMFPLQHKSIISMRRMQEIQPQVKAIQDRYAKFKATDPEKQKMNQELMTLYREKGVNPAGGCVPILLTMPVLLAMWAMLQTAIELRGAPFIGWIHDLTQHDPYYVTPVLMGLTQFWQQKLTPATGADPAQQKMMMVMPAVMTAMFLWLPAGAILYYTVGGLLRIGQQYLTNSIIGPPNIKVPRPPAERRIKKVGSGKTEAAASGQSAGAPGTPRP
jgi:YidC/Oxa1 family membrane protein insertase